MASIYFDTREKGDTVVNTFSHDRMYFGPDGMTMVNECGNDLCAQLKQTNFKKVVLNFRIVEFMTSAMLNKLIVYEKNVKGLGGRLVMCHIRPEIYEVFVITRLHQLFNIEQTESDALAALT